MRDFLIPLVLIVVVVGAISIYFLASPTHAGPVVATAPISADPNPPAPPKKVAPRPKRAIGEIAAANTAPTVPAPASQIEDKPVAPARAPRPIPTGTPEQVNLGMDVTKVVELLGEPDLTALSIRRGSLSETYIYKKRPGQNLAFIRLEGGRVVPPR